MVHADWELQEKRLGRSPQSPEAIRAALRRAALLLDDLRGNQGLGHLAAEAAELDGWPRARRSASLDEPGRLDLYRQIRALTRELALKNPLVTSRPILFMQRRRAVGYMLYEYLGWYYAHGNDPNNGAKNPKFPRRSRAAACIVLEQPGRTLAGARAGRRPRRGRGIS